MFIQGLWDVGGRIGFVWLGLGFQLKHGWTGLGLGNNETEGVVGLRSARHNCSFSRMGDRTFSAIPIIIELSSIIQPLD